MDRPGREIGVLGQPQFARIAGYAKPIWRFLTPSLAWANFVVWIPADLTIEPGCVNSAGALIDNIVLRLIS